MVGTPHKPPVKTFKCGGCGAPLTIRGLGLTTTMACPSCGTIIDIHNPDYHIIHKAKQRTRSITIPLGRRGKIKGVQYEIIGYLERCDSSGYYTWEEYLLMNPYRGFAWLVCNQGHWSYVQMTKDIADWDDTEAHFRGHKFKRFLFDSAEVTYVMGEFYWRIKVGDKVNTMDFISPPFMLSAERDASDVMGEIVWSVGEYLSPDEVAETFGRSDTISFPSGVGANQPNPHRARLYSILLPWILAVVVSFFIAFGSSHKNQEVFDYSGIYYASSSVGTAAPIVSKPFFVSNTSNIAVDLDSQLNNNWLYMDLTLVNSENQEEYDSSIEVSYYSGIEGGESWSEGSFNGRAYFSGVDKGNYTLTFVPQSQTQMTPLQIPYRIRVVEDVYYWGNFGFTFLLINLLPLLLLVLSWSFEARRWRNSDQVSSE